MAYLRLRNLSVEFPLYLGGSRSLKKALLAASSQGNIGRDALDRVTVRALDRLTFDIADGDRLAVIGGNGAGKTTLLRVLAGIFQPTQGRLFAAGRVSALLNPSVGLDPDSTGRENILLRGVYLGIHPREMRPRIDEVARFAELGGFLDMPVRTYSAGMMIRLAFAVSTCVPTEILLMDEWLSAGDAHFLARARARMADFVRSSKIMVLATHSMALAEEWCNRGLLLEQGRVAAAGPVHEVVALYREREAAAAVSAVGQPVAG
jgi:ABC-type polysaccharide/polyol phosphate transport system ATPase subunit